MHIRVMQQQRPMCRAGALIALGITLCCGTRVQPANAVQSRPRIPPEVEQEIARHEGLEGGITAQRVDVASPPLVSGGIPPLPNSFWLKIVADSSAIGAQFSARTRGKVYRLPTLPIQLSVRRGQHVDVLATKSGYRPFMESVPSNPPGSEHVVIVKMTK